MISQINFFFAFVCCSSSSWLFFAHFDVFLFYFLLGFDVPFILLFTAVSVTDRRVTSTSTMAAVCSGFCYTPAQLRQYAQDCTPPLPRFLLPDYLQVCRGRGLGLVRNTQRGTHDGTRKQKVIPAIVSTERFVGCIQGTPTTGTGNCRTSHYVSVENFIQFFFFFWSSGHHKHSNMIACFFNARSVGTKGKKYSYQWLCP